MKALFQSPVAVVAAAAVAIGLAGCAHSNRAPLHGGDR
jgi:hypothetical protein